MRKSGEKLQFSSLNFFQVNYLNTLHNEKAFNFKVTDIRILDDVYCISLIKNTIFKKTFINRMTLKDSY